MGPVKSECQKCPVAAICLPLGEEEMGRKHEPVVYFCQSCGKYHFVLTTSDTIYESTFKPACCLPVKTISSCGCVRRKDDGNTV